MSAPFDIAATLHQLADAAERETLTRFRAPLDVRNKLKSGFDPVTEGDREAERAMRAVIDRRFPGHAIIGEEFGTKTGSDPWTWILDPIDGTRAFVSGLPLWGTLVGLYRDGRPHAGMLAQPFTGERYWCDGEAAWFARGDETTPLGTSAVEDLADATVLTTDPDLFEGAERRSWDRLAGEVQLRRYGCDCYAYAMVAAGHADLVVESGLHIYDIAALIPIVERAGGVVTGWDGMSAAQGGRVVAAANPTLHAAALTVLAGA